MVVDDATKLDMRVHNAHMHVLNMADYAELC